MKAPLGAVVGLYFDTPRDVLVGHYIRTPTGRVYRVISVRRQARGRYVGRWHLRCVVVDGVPLFQEPPAYVHFLRWYKRGRRRGR